MKAVILKILVILAIVTLTIIFINPIKDFINRFLTKTSEEAEEIEIIGTGFGYNPRVEEIQRILKKAGFDPGSVDGRLGEKTRKAIKEFQRANDLKPQGTLDSKTWARLIEVDEELLKQQKPPLSKESTQLISERIEEISYPDKKPLEDGEKIKDIKPVLKKNIRQIQVALKTAGFNPGPIDGKMGKRTRKALKKFQKSKGLKPDGIVGDKTLEGLNKYLSTDKIKKEGG
ncbi:MAG: peptidoglycan-binding protein [Candidatus Omnitrophica bacterium]|nr:peptidoglycan-binding protein [Candidatus Omnitrophota bacterium]